MTDFTASNGIVISYVKDAGMTIKDWDASTSEARIMTIQARKSEALREFFEKMHAHTVNERHDFVMPTYDDGEGLV